MTLPASAYAAAPRLRQPAFPPSRPSLRSGASQGSIMPNRLRGICSPMTVHSLALLHTSRQPPEHKLIADALCLVHRALNLSECRNVPCIDRSLMALSSLHALSSLNLQGTLLCVRCHTICARPVAPRLCRTEVVSRRRLPDAHGRGLGVNRPPHCPVPSGSSALQQHHRHVVA